MSKCLRFIQCGVCVSIVIYVLLLSGIPYEYTIFPLDRHLACFLFWAIMNKVTADVLVKFSNWHRFLFLWGWYLWMVRLKYICMVNVMRNCQSDCIIFTLLPAKYANCSCFIIFANCWSYQSLVLTIPVGLKWHLFMKIKVFCYIYRLCFMTHLKLISFLSYQVGVKVSFVLFFPLYGYLVAFAEKLSKCCGSSNFVRVLRQFGCYRSFAFANKF